MTAPRRRSSSTHRTPQPASSAANSPCEHTIKLFGPNRYTYVIPIGAYRAIQHRFPQHLVHPGEYVPWRDDIDHTIRLRGNTVAIQTRAPFQLKKWLEEAGYPAHLELMPPGPHLATADAERLDRLIDPMWHLTELLSCNLSGQFEVQSPRDVPQLVRALASAFPLAPCVMPFPSIDAAAVFRDELRRIVNEPVTLMRGLSKRLGSRLIVSTYQALLTGDHREIPLVIVPYWPGSIHQKLKVLAQYPDMERLYLIRTEQDLVGESNEAELLHRIGPMIWEFGRHQPRAQHFFHIVNFGGQQPNDPLPRGLQVDKRRLYWRHSCRNQLTANLARQVATDEVSLQTLPADRQQVIVLVEVTEHAHKLAALLSGWPIITPDDVTSALPPRCIMTLCAAVARPTLAPLYLVNACGGPASPWLESWLAERALARTVVRLVDLGDGFSGEAATLSRGRQASYRRAGAVWRPLPKHILKPALDALGDVVRQADACGR